MISGPESTGKTTGCPNSAACLWPLVVEVARDMLEQLGGAYSEPDVYRMAIHQWRLQESIRQTGGLRAGRYRPADLRIWLEERFGTCSPWIAATSPGAPCGPYLLCVPDIDWEPDPFGKIPTTATFCWIVTGECAPRRRE
ncbi:MAG: hypothetical protein R2787_07555 [Saprospiraceae bacterium]